MELPAATARHPAESRGETLAEADLFARDYLLTRALLIDQVDRPDDEFEAFLLELLAESSVTIPELGPRRAAVPPVVVLTPNRTRGPHDALTRRCL